MTLLTVSEVSDRLGLSLSATYRRLSVSGGPIAVYRMGFGKRAPLRVSVKELERYIAASFVAPALAKRFPDREFVVMGASDFEAAKAEVLRRG